MGRAAAANSTGCRSPVAAHRRGDNSHRSRTVILEEMWNIVLGVVGSDVEEPHLARGSDLFACSNRMLETYESLTDWTAAADAKLVNGPCLRSFKPPDAWTMMTSPSSNSSFRRLTMRSTASAGSASGGMTFGVRPRRDGITGPDYSPLRIFDSR